MEVRQYLQRLEKLVDTIADAKYYDSTDKRPLGSIENLKQRILNL